MFEGIKTFDDLLLRIKDFKTNYKATDCKLDIKSLSILLMGGAMDSLFPSPPTLSERKTHLNALLKAMNSKSTLAVKKEGEIAIFDIDNELTRNIWLSKTNPLHRFSLSSFYKGALTSMGFEQRDSPNILYQHEDLDIIANFDVLYTERVFNYYSSANCRRRCAVVGVYKGRSEMTCKNGSKKLTAIINDGQSDMGVTIWSRRGSNEYDPNIVFKIKDKGSPVVVIGKPNKYGGRNQFTVSSILALGF